MARVYGNTNPLLTLKVGAGSATDFGPDVVSVEFTDGDGGPVTMSDFANGIRPVQMNVSYVLDFGATKAHQYHTTNAGAKNVTYSFQLDSGAVSQDNPKFTGTLTMPAVPLFAVEAGDKTEPVQFEVSYALDTYTKAIV